MNNIEKRNELKRIINDKLLPLFKEKCIHADVPFYQNVGDVLIWQGCKAFYKENNIDCLYAGSHETFCFPSVDRNVVICFNGGGNIGDIYPEHIELLKMLVFKYPHNRIIVFPQTVYYKDKRQLEIDFSILSSHHDLHFAARDKVVYEELLKIPNLNVLLVPDMAFFISETEINTCSDGKGVLAIDRTDCEVANSKIDYGQACVRDWPVLTEKYRMSTFINKLFYHLYLLGLRANCFRNLWELYSCKYFCHAILKEGVRFIRPYRKIISTRLHGCILSILLDKKHIVFVDNSYGKNKNFYDTWLSNLDTIQFI